MRFVGRDRELKKLNELYQEEEFQFVVIYGRRRVGKTMLINEFLKKKRSAYYMAVEGIIQRKSVRYFKSVIS